MRSQGQVRHKLKQVLFRHLQKKLRLALRRRPDTCAYNKVVGGDSIQVFACDCPESSGKLCDARLPVSLEQALTCPWWQSSKSKEELKAEFKQLIESPDRGAVAAEYPDVAALLWVLDEDVSDAVLGSLGDDGEVPHE